MKQQGGSFAIAQLLADLRDEPMTMGELQSSGKAKGTFIYSTVRQLHAAGLLHIVGERKSYCRQPLRPVYAFGPGVDAVQAPKAKLRLTADLLAFVHLWRTLSTAPHTAVDAAQETGTFVGRIRKLLPFMRELGLVRIAGWHRGLVAGGVWSPEFEVGTGKDVKRPAKLTTKKRNARYRRRRKERNAAPRIDRLLVQPQAGQVHKEVTL